MYIIQTNVHSVKCKKTSLTAHDRGTGWVYFAVFPGSARTEQNRHRFLVQTAFIAYLHGTKSQSGDTSRSILVSHSSMLSHVTLNVLPHLLTFCCNLSNNRFLTIFISVTTSTTTVDAWKFFTISNVVHFQYDILHRSPFSASPNPSV
jgi:hypothetical protein